MHTVERRAVAALWGVPNIGVRTIAALETNSGLAEIFSKPFAEWWHTKGVSEKVRTERNANVTLEAIADRLEKALRRYAYSITFKGDVAYPAALAEVGNAPPVLFYLGPAGEGPPRRRVGMVGSRTPDTGFLPWVRRMAADIARQGVGVVSGLAAGVDTACHEGAFEVGGETWAFLGSAIDQIDPAQSRLLPRFLETKGTVFSEYPPNVRADETTFVRRNRLISGSADAVVVARAGAKSGALHTARFARDQKRTLLAVPGDPFNPVAEGCNQLLRAGAARVCRSAEDVLEAVGAPCVKEGTPVVQPAPVASVTDPFQLQVLQVLTKVPEPFDVIAAQLGGDSGRIASALTMLELSGWVVQSAGRRYEKVQ